MAIKCEICKKEFRRIEDVYTHPYSFTKPIFVHRECVALPVRLLAAGGPHFTILANLEMAIPSLVLLIIIFVALISQLPFSMLSVLLIILLLLLISFRIYFMRYYLDAVRSFNK